MDQMTRKNALIDLKNLLEENGIECWITCGTLLGAIREGDLLSYDKDIDLAIDAKDKYKVIETIEKDKDFFFYKIWRRELAVIKNNVKIDIFCTSKVGYNRYYYSYRKNSFTGKWDTEQIQILLDKNFYPLKEIDFLGTRFHTPNNAEKYLEDAYGDWKTDKPEWQSSTIAWHPTHRQIGIILPVFGDGKTTIESIKSTLPSDWYRLYIGHNGKLNEDQREYYNELVKEGHFVFEFPNRSTEKSMKRYLKTEANTPYLLFLNESVVIDNNFKIQNLTTILDCYQDINTVYAGEDDEDLNYQKSYAGRTQTQVKYSKTSKKSDVYMMKRLKESKRNYKVYVPGFDIKRCPIKTTERKESGLVEIKELGSKSKRVGVIIINFLRPDTTIRCIESLREVDPSINIYVGDQDLDNEKLKQKCQDVGAYHVNLPYDCGIGVARNLLVERIKADGHKYVLWGDNDFIFNENFNIDDTIKILETREDVGVVGGSLIEHGRLQHYERLMYYDRSREILVLIPLEYTYTEPMDIDGIKYYDCDMTFNFCVARTDVFNDKVKWSEEIKVKYEHSFYFIQLKEHSPYKVVYCPSFQAIHAKVRTDEYNKFRNRKTDETEYKESLNLKVGYCIGDTGWDYTEGRPLNIENIKAQNPIVGNKKTIKKEPVFYSEEIQSSDNMKSVVQLLAEYSTDLILLKETCKQAVKYKSLKENVNSLFVGVNEGLKNKIIKKFTIEGFELQGNSLKRDDVVIHLLPIDNIAQTKTFPFFDWTFRVPFPVLRYLDNTFGKGWDKDNV